MTAWRTAIWLYPWDVADEGADQVLAAVSGSGIRGMNLALAYHSGMFVLPHNPRRKLFFPAPGLYFTPDAARYAGLSIKPRVDALAAENIAGKMRATTARRGLELSAWVVCMHNTGIGTAFPDATLVNAFGDRHIAHLCPANPDVRAWVTAVVLDLADRDFDAISIESLEYMLPQHGFHHEVWGVSMTPYMSYLFGLCFCRFCLAAAQARGVDGHAVQQFVRQEIEAFFDGDLDRGHDNLSWSEVQQQADEAIGAYHRMRVDVVTSLFEELRADWPQRATRLEVTDFGPLYPFAADSHGEPSGLHHGRIRRYIDALHPTPYRPSPAANAEALRAYRSGVPAGTPIIPAIRAIPPQTLSAADLRANMEACDPTAVAGYTFYNYGFMRLATLDWIRDSLQQLQSAVAT